MGNYDECLDIKEIDTKFCHASFTPKFFPPPETHILDTKRIVSQNPYISKTTISIFPRIRNYLEFHKALISALDFTIVF